MMVSVLSKFLGLLVQETMKLDHIFVLHLIHTFSWGPRGFPIDQLKDNFVNGPLDTIEFGDLPFSSIGVIQSLCNGDPDNDTVFRMTCPDSTKFSFDRSEKSIPLYSPYNAQTTTHLYSAIWGLYLPSAS
jgi:hypothetical protein